MDVHGPRGRALHDAAALTAESVVASLDRARGVSLPGELGTSGLYHSYLGQAGSARSTAHRVRIVTPSPMADLLDLLVEIPIVSPVTLAGTGPYRLIVEDESGVHMEAASDHWRGAPAYHGVNWRNQPDEMRRREELLSGAVDVAVDLSAGLSETVQADGRTRHVQQEGKVAVIFMLNCQAAAPAQTGACAGPLIMRLTYKGSSCGPERARPAAQRPADPAPLRL